MLEEKIRKSFNYWLQICSIKAKKSVVYDGKIIIIIEGLENIKDQETGLESNIKFWLPKFFPTNVRVIVTTSKNSESYTNLIRNGSPVLSLCSDSSTLNKMLVDLKTREFLCKDSHRDRVFKLLEDRLKEDPSPTSLFVKAMVSCLAPYKMEGILDESSVDLKRVNDILKEVDFDKITKIDETSELIDFILKFFEDKIIPKKKYKCVMATLSMTFKGLLLEEILQIVK